MEGRSDELSADSTPTDCSCRCDEGNPPFVPTQGTGDKSFQAVGAFRDQHCLGQSVTQIGYPLEVEGTDLIRGEEGICSEPTEDERGRGQIL